MAMIAPTTHPLTEPLDSPFDPYAPELLQPFIPPGETEMSSPSRIDSSGNDRQDSVVTLVAGPTIDPQRRQQLSLQLIAPAILVAVITAGIASALLAWLIVHSSQSSLTEVWQDKAFLLDEGTKVEGDSGRTARLMGLTISSAASTLVGISSPILISLYAFRAAQAWLKASHRGSSVHDVHLPTPLQYGLLLELLTGGGLTTLFSTSRYFLKRQNASASRILKQSFVVVVTIYILTHAISGVDLWLHTVTTTITSSTSTPSTTPRQLGIGQNTCPPYVPSGLIRVCLMTQGGWAGDPRPGMLVVSNTSTSLQAITLADHADMAVLVVPGVPNDLQFRSTSFGARTSCELITPLCHLGGDVTEMCTGFPRSIFPVVTYENDTDSLTSSESKVFLLSSNCHQNNQSCTQLSPDQITNEWVILSPDSDMLNSYTLWLQLVWASDGAAPFTSPNNTDIVSVFSNKAAMLANCSLSFYNVTLDYSNGTYALVDEELLDVALSDGLAVPTRLGHYLSHLIANVEGLAFTSASPDEVTAFLTQDLGRLALGSAANITNLRKNTLSLSTVQTASLGRYPFWPVVILLALLYTHALLALIIFLITFLFSRSVRIRVPPPGGSGATVVASTLELVQLRLTSPVALVAALFPPAVGPAARASLAAQTDVISMFDDRPGVERLRVGIGSEDAGQGCAQFGVWQGHAGKDDGWGMGRS
ncbi:hypothetical protein BC834DRAFT_966272 [Gloeopeniophorella convolvens]|nr:hypothetical protein BC834DRAFT_966272 [Gloeopeniophorella convolvens]